MKKLLFVVLLICKTELYPAYILDVHEMVTCPDSVLISWAGAASDRWELYRSSTLNGTKIFIGLKYPGDPTPWDYNAPAGSSFYYFVLAIDSDGGTAWSGGLYVKVDAALPTPATPATTLANKNSINITWLYANYAIWGMNIYRSDDYGPFLPIVMISNPNSLDLSIFFWNGFWLDTTVMAGHSYSYKIRPYNRCGEGPLCLLPSGIISIPYPSTNLTVDSLRTTKLGDSIFVSFEALNSGTFDIVKRFYFSIYNNNVRIKGWYADSLLSNWFFRLNYSFKSIATTNVIKAFVDDTYLIDESNETDNFAIDTIFTPGVSIQNSSQNPTEIFSVYPNPFKSTINFNFGSTKNTPIFYIYSLDGKLIKQFKGERTNAFTWNTQNAPSGIYLLKAQINNKDFKKKLYLKK